MIAPEAIVKHGDNCRSQRAKCHERDGPFIGLLPFGNDKGAEKYPAADKRSHREENNAKVEVRFGHHWHVRREHDARAALQNGNIGCHCTNQHQAEAGPGPFWPSQSRVQHHGRGEIQHRHLEKDDPHQENIKAVCRQREIEPVRRKEMHGRPTCQRD